MVERSWAGSRGTGAGGTVGLPSAAGGWGAGLVSSSTIRASIGRTVPVSDSTLCLPEAVATGAAAQLVVDAAGLVALGAEDVQAARRQHLRLFGVALGLERGELFLEAHGVDLGAGLAGRLRIDGGAGHELGVAAEDDVGPAAGPAGGD